MFFEWCNPQDCNKIMTLLWKDIFEKKYDVVSSLSEIHLNEFPEDLNKKFRRNCLDYNSCFCAKNN